MKLCSLFIVIFHTYTAIGQQLELTYYPNNISEIRRANMLVDIITLNLKKNGWSTILCYGHFADEFYSRLQKISYPLIVTNMEHEDLDIEDVVPYYSNTIIVDLRDIKEYKYTMLKLTQHTYWHPHANIILYYHESDIDILPKLYFSMWFYRAFNVIVVQYDDTAELLLITHFSPYICDDNKRDSHYGCRTSKKSGIRVTDFEKGFICEEGCHNVSLHSKFRANNLGTCIGFSTIKVPYDDPDKILTTINLFEDKTKDFRGFTFRAYATEVEPFNLIFDHGNGNYSLGSRDGSLWNSIAKLMNFTIDLTPVMHVMKEPFNFERQIKHLFDYGFRKADLFLVPIYLFDIILVEIDFSFPYRESGVCIMSHRAGFETTLFDSKAIHANRNIIIQFILCFLGIWVTFSIYKGLERKRLNFDQIGKDFLNAIRNVLLLSLCKPPKRNSFRVFLTISIWSFFVLNFAIQATIISFLTAVKRGKDVDTFEEMIDKGYLIYGMASPDLILPDTEEKFRIINSRLVSVLDLFGCILNITADPLRFCLIDCSVGRYLERNRLNEKGEQYLHIAQDRMHSNYLSLIFPKYSPLTEPIDKYLIRFYEAGLIKKWERHRFADIKEDAPTKPLGMDDFKSLFDIYCYALGFIFIIFMLEVLIFCVRRILIYCLKIKNNKIN